VLYFPVMDAAVFCLLLSAAAWKATSGRVRSVSMNWVGVRLLVKNLARAWQLHLLRFRLVTFGLYEPHPLYGRRVFLHPWWQINPRVAWLLLRRAAAYGRWLAEMEAATQRGQTDWWTYRVGQQGAQHLRAWMDAENAL
jgi:hypothetical protein